MFTVLIGWILWAFGNIALVCSFGGLLALIFLRHKLKEIPLMTEALMVACFALGAFGYGWNEYAAGRDAGIKSERLKWEIEMDNLRAAKKVEKIKAEERLSEIGTETLKREQAIVKRQLEERQGFAKRLAELQSEQSIPIAKPRVVVTEVIKEVVKEVPNACPKAKPVRCPNFYNLPADSVLLRELKRSRGQEGTGGNPG